MMFFFFLSPSVDSDDRYEDEWLMMVIKTTILMYPYGSDWLVINTEWLMRKLPYVSICHIYHLVMTFTVCHGKYHHAIKNGKPSISIRAMASMAMLNSQRVLHGITITILMMMMMTMMIMMIMMIMMMVILYW